MESRKKKTIFILIVAIAFIILIGVGSTFAYFSASATAEDAVSIGSAEYELDLKDNTDLIKANLIPTEERFVDIATTKRVDENGNFLKPFKESETSDKLIIKDTACVDDNEYNICSIYSFTITNPNKGNDLPLYISLIPTLNTFENLYYKVLDSDLNEVIEATRLLDNRYEIDPNTGTYLKDSETGEWIKKENFNELTIEPYVLTNINKTLPKTTDENNPSKVTYHIVLWIMEIHDDQTAEDSGKLFTSKLTVSTGPEGTGITGVFASTGTE